ncbi:MAG: hypothetical protein AAGC64_12250, partial [Bacteroidota bacterium]
GGFDYAPDLPSGGGSGGGVIFIIEIYEEEEPPADWLARTACDSGSPESFCPNDTSPDVVEADANCPSNPIGVLDAMESKQTFGKLCDDINFLHSTQSFKAEVLNLGGTWVNHLYNFAIDVELGVNCIDIPEY